MKPLFGTNVVPSVGGRSDPLEDALHAETLGFDLVTLWDHLHGDHPSYETWTLLTWIASRTERIRVGTNVLGLPYRPPAVTAKMAETLHRLSGGRVVLGLGAGGSDEEFAGFGVPVRTRRQKLEALEEALVIIRGLWTQTPFTFEGRHYRLEGGLFAPKPDPPIPIWLGVYGERALRLTGRLADGWLPSMYYAPPDVAKAKLDIVRRGAGEAGRDPDSLTYAYNVGVLLHEGAESDGRMVAGGSAEVADQLAGLVRLGFDCLMLWPRGDRAEGRERLAKEIIPAVRDAVA